MARGLMGRSAPAVGTRRAAWIACCVVLAALLAFAIRGLDLARLATAIRSAHVSWLAAAVVCDAALLPLWALQWKLLAPRSYRNTFAGMLGVVAITSATLNTAILLAGEATGVVLLVTRIGLERTGALSVLAMDQVLVGIAKLAVLTTAACLLDLPAWMQRGVAGLALGVVALLAGTLVAAWHADAIADRSHATFPPWLLAALRSMGRALSPLRSPSLFGGALLLAFAKKGVEILGIVCVQHAFGVTLPLGSAVLIMGALGIATMLPVAPANVGVYEGVVAIIYTRFGIPMEQAVGMAVVQHACYLAAVALPGYVWLAGSDPARSASAAS